MASGNTKGKRLNVVSGTRSFVQGDHAKCVQCNVHRKLRVNNIYLTSAIAHGIFSTLSTVKEAKLAVLHSYVSVMIMQRRELVATQSDGLLLLCS